MRKIIVLLFLILSISLLAQELNELSIVGKAEKTNDIVSSSIKDVNNRKASCIIFLTDLEVDMDFRPNIELVKLISNAGRFEVYVQPGERVIEVLASGFKPFNLVLSSFGISKLESGDVYQIEITGNKINNLIPVNFIIEPSGAEIYVDEKSKGVVNNIQIPAGKHIFKIVKEGYQTIEKEEDISINNNLFRFELSEQMYVAVSIKTTPDGATIYLDDTKATITPKPFFYPDGNYTIRIEKENYETIEESITISSPQTNKNYTLEDIRASLTIKTHPNATVYINDESYNGGVSDLKLSPQIVHVRVEMPKAETITKSIVLKKKDTIIKELFPEVETGKIIVNTIPVDAEIVLTGDGGEKYSSKKPTTFKDVPIGKYELIIKANGYKTHEESFKVETDETVSKRIVLEEGSDKIVREKKITKTEKSQVKSKGSFFDLYTNYTYSNQDYYYYEVSTNNFLIPEITYHYKHYDIAFKNDIILNLQNYSNSLKVDHSDYDDTFSKNTQLISLITNTKYFFINLFYINLDSQINFYWQKEEWKEYEFKSEFESNYGAFNAGFGIEDEKNIHLLTPKHKYKKGIFVNVNYSAYLWNNIDGVQIKDNPKKIDVVLEYAFINNSSFFMINPYFYYNIDAPPLDYYITTFGINFIRDLNKLTQLTINIFDNYYKGASDGGSENHDFTIDLLVNYFPINYIDIYLNYNLSTYDSNRDGLLNSKDKMLSSFGGGLGLFWGYN